MERGSRCSVVPQLEQINDFSHFLISLLHLGLSARFSSIQTSEDILSSRSEKLEAIRRYARNNATHFLDERDAERLSKLIEVTRFYLLRGAYPKDEISAFERERVEPNMSVFDYFINLLFITPFYGEVEYVPLHQTIIDIVSTKIFVRIDEFSQLPAYIEMLLKARFTNQIQYDVLGQRVIDFISKDFKKLPARVKEVLESRWGGHPSRREILLPSHVNKQNTFNYVKDWQLILKDYYQINHEWFTFIKRIHQAWFPGAPLARQDLAWLL